MKKTPAEILAQLKVPKNFVQVVNQHAPPSNSVAQVKEWVWNPEPNNPQPPPVQQPLQQQPTAKAVDGWFWFWFILGGIILFTIFLAVFLPLGYYPHHHHHHTVTPAPDDEDDLEGKRSGHKPNNCSTDEVYDPLLGMCMMVPHFPKAVSLAIMDQATPACTDVFRHACGRWIDEHTNENRGFSGLAAINAVAVKRIIEDPSVPNLNPFFQSCKSTLVDQVRSGMRRRMYLDDNKLTQLAILGRMLEPLVSHANLPIVFGRMTAAGYTVPVSLVIQSHPKEPGLVPMFTYDGFTGDDQDVEWIRMHFALIYGDDAQKTDDETTSLVSVLNRINMMRPDRDGDMETYEGWKEYVKQDGPFDKTDSMSWEIFTKQLCPRFGWEQYIAELSMRLSLPELKFSKTQTVWAYSRRYFEWFDPAAFSLQEWRTFVTFSVLYHTHDFFPEIPNDILLRKPVNVRSPLRKGGPHRRLKKRRLSPTSYGYKRMALKQKEKRENWHKYRARRPDLNHQKIHDVPSAPAGEDEGLVVTVRDCINAAKYMLPGILSKEYLKREFPSNGELIRQRVKGMVEAIRDRFVKNLQETKWMDKTTRDAQADKIKAIVPRVVHPTEWMEEIFPPGREMDPLRYLRNLGIIKEEHVRRNLALWSESNSGVACDARCRDRITFFGAPLFTVNAWYNPDRNLITIPAGILKIPFYDDRFSNASAYGTIGWVVGHELSHAEDANGVLYDKNGLMRATWSSDSLAQFTARAQCIVREYGSPEGCSNENYGEQTLSEDIADINGLRLAYEALFYDNAPQRASAADLLASKKEFFMAAAQMWCASYTPQALCENSRDDVHAIASYRVRKTFAHLPYFAEAFSCDPGTPMHRHVHDRCVLYSEEAIQK